MAEYTSYDLIEWNQPFERRRQALPEPAGVEVLIRVTAAGEVMPQKSTFFAPKLPTGLVFRPLEAGG